MVRSEMGVSRVVVGHTVQLSGQVSEMCGGSLLMADVALSREMSSRKEGEVLGLECRASEAGSEQEEGQGSVSETGGMHASSGGGANDGGGGSAGEQCSWVQKGAAGQQPGTFSSKEECEGRVSGGGLRVWKADSSGKGVARLLRKPPP